MNTRFRFAIALAIVLCAFHASAHARGAPQGSAFTYQGLLKQGGAPVSGSHHLRFQLWDALAGGTQVGSDIDAAMLVITEGLFTTALDFGPGAFNGSARWLQVQVITNGGATVTTLTPRQAVNAAPYALFALNADGPNLANLNASNLATGTVPGAQLAGTYANALTLSHSANSFTGNGAGLTGLNASSISAGTIDGGLLSGTYGNALTLSNAANSFSGSGAGLIDLNAANIASGTLSAARLPSGGAWPLSSTLDLDAGTFALDPVNNRVGIGTSTPFAPLHIRSTGPSMVLQDTASAANQAGYVSYRNNASTETAWVGYGTAGSPHFSIVNARGGGNLGFSVQGIESLTLAASGRLGVLTSTPTHPLTVSGSTRINSNLEINRISAGQPGLISFRVADVEQGSITVSGSTVSYNGFMGSHYAWMDGRQSIDRGALIRMTGENRRLNGSAESDVVYGIEPTASANDPACLGAYLGIMESDKPADLANPHLIAAVGNGEMLVVDSGTGDIQPGDYLISSDVSGCAIKDDPKRFPVGHVIAAAQAVIWDGVTESVAGGRRHRRISVFFESFERGSEAADEIASLRAEVAELKELVGQLSGSRVGGSSK